MGIRREAVRPLTPTPLLGGGDRRAVASRNAAVLACNGRSRQFHTAQHLQARHGCKVVWLNCGKPRLGRSTQGADIRLPGSFAAWAKIRGRCTWFRQCRQARDTDPSLLEPSMAINHRQGIKSNVFFSPPWKGGAGGGCGPHVLSSELAASIHPRPSLRRRGEGVAPHQHPSWQVGGPREAGRDGKGERRERPNIAPHRRVMTRFTRATQLWAQGIECGTCCKD